MKGYLCIDTRNPSRLTQGRVHLAIYDGFTPALIDSRGNHAAMSDPGTIVAGDGSWFMEIGRPVIRGSYFSPKQSDVLEGQNMTEYLGKKLSINEDLTVDVVGHYEAPETSVLAGQIIRRHFGTYPDLNAAREAHPEAGLWFHPMTESQVTPHHLPDGENY